MPYRLRTLLFSSRWLRFSLRGMFVVITLFGIWLGLQVNWLRQRRIAREWIEQHEGPGKWSNVDPKNVVKTRRDGTRYPDRLKDPPWNLRLLGESRLAYINLDKSKLTDGDIQRINSLQSLFPEADGVHVHEPGWSHRWPPENPSAFLKYPARLLNGKIVYEPATPPSQ